MCVTLQERTAKMTEEAQAQVDRIKEEFVEYQRGKAQEIAALDEKIRKLIQGGASIEPVATPRGKQVGGAGTVRKTAGQLPARGKKVKQLRGKKEAVASPVKVAAAVPPEPVHVPCTVAMSQVSHLPCVAVDLMSLCGLCPSIAA